MTEIAESDPVLIAILALLVERRQRDAGETDTKIELLLSQCGLSNEVIGRLLNKRPDTVRVAILRAQGPSEPKKAKNSKAQ